MGASQLSLANTEEALFQQVREHPEMLRTLAPGEFEQLVGELLASFGWEVQPTPKGDNRGYNIFAVSTVGPGLQATWVVECKASSPSRPIGVKEIRDLYGAKLEVGASNALMVTAGTFTQGAKDFAQSKRDLLLVDGNEMLSSWLSGSKPPKPGAKETLLRFVLKSTGNPLDLMSRFHPRGTYALNRTAWRGKAPRTCAVVSVKSRPSSAANDEPAEFDVLVAYRPKGVITFAGGTKYDGWTAMMLDRAKDGTLLDGHGKPLPNGHPPVFLPVEVYDDVDFNEIDFGEFVGEFEVGIKRVSQDSVWQQFREAKGGSIGIAGLAFVAARRQRPMVKIVISNSSSGIASDGFGTRIVSVNKSTPHLQKVLMDELTGVVFGFLEGRYSISTVAFSDYVMVELDGVLVDCTPNDEGKESRFDCFRDFIPDSFIEDLASLLVANFELDVSIVDGPTAGLLLRRTQPAK